MPFLSKKQTASFLFFLLTLCAPIAGFAIAPDFIEPAPLTGAAWTDDALTLRSLSNLSYRVQNHQTASEVFSVELLWDAGTTDAYVASLGTITVPGGGDEEFRVDPSAIPAVTRYGSVPGSVRVSLTSSSGDLHILPAFYVLPVSNREFPEGADWLYELATPEDLNTLLSKNRKDPEAPNTLRRAEWAPSGATADEDGGVLNGSTGGSTSLKTYESPSSVATKASLTTCVRWQARTIDSGFGEDRLSWANSNTAIVTAYGVRIQITAADNSFSGVYDTSPWSGCVTWNGVSGKNYKVRIYYYVTDADGNMIRYHSAGDAVFGNYPGGTYHYDVFNYFPSSSNTTYVNGGNWSPRSTAMSTASMMTRYYYGVTSDKQIHMADSLSGGGSSAHHCTSNCNYSNDAYVRLQTSNSDHRRRKFITGHELGHARAVAQQGGLEPSIDTSVGGGGCDDGGSYWMESREWSSVALREGMAHFAAVWTYNYASENNGFIRWFNTTYDVEFNNPALSGGHLGNNCGGTTYGQSTNLDAMRMYWDWTTPSASANRATRGEVMNAYEGMVLAVPAKDEYYDELSNAASTLPVGVANWLTTSACWNGVTSNGC